MQNEAKKLILEAEIELLLSLKHETAFTGDLSSLKQRSYVEFSQVIKLLNEKRIELKKLKNDLS